VGCDVMVCGPVGRYRVYGNLLSHDMKILIFLMICKLLQVRCLTTLSIVETVQR